MKRASYRPQKHIQRLLQSWMVWPFIGVFLASTVASSIIANPQSSALAGSEFRASKIIDDSVFFSTGSMSAQTVQNFLNAKVPTCDTWGTQMRGSQTRAAYGAANGNPAPYTCLRDYTQDTPSMNGESGLCNTLTGGVKSAAQIIADVGAVCGINPQVLIVLLQKEQSLITDDWPWQTQYDKATGFGCPDTAPCNPAYGGFFYQVYSAARQFKKYARDADQFGYRAFRNNNILYNPNGACGSSTVYIENQATAGLYVYTPYQPNTAALNNLYGTGDGCSSYGNRNFWRMFNDWFGSTLRSPLVRSPDSPTYYLLTNGKKFAIASGDILYAYGIQSMPLAVVDTAFLNSVPDGGMLNTIFTVPGDGTVYMADGGKRYGIASGEYCVKWGLSCGDATVQKEIGLDVFSRLADGGVLQPVMKFSDSYYLMDTGKKLPFLSTKAMTDRGYQTANTTTVINWTNATRPFGNSLPENNTYVKFASTNAIYLYAGNTFFSIPDYETFINWFGPNGVSYLDSNSAYNTTPPSTTATLSTLVTYNGSTTLVGYKQRFVLPNSTPTATPLSIGSYAQLAPLISGKQQVTVDSSKAFAIPGGTIFALQDAVLRPLPSLIDLRLAFSDSDVMSVPSTILSAYSTGKIYSITGRVFKPNASAMYLYGGDRYLWALGSMAELQSANTWSPGSIETGFSNLDYSGIKIYSNLVTVNNTVHAVQGDGSLRPLPSSIVTSSNLVMPLDGQIENRLRVDYTPPKFIRFDNGTIFKIDSNTINPISSLATYLGSGGTASNTVQLPLKALPTFSIGPTI